MKTTLYFKEQVLRKRSYLKLKWIREALRKPVQKEVQSDGRIRYFVFIFALLKTSAFKLRMKAREYILRQQGSLNLRKTPALKLEKFIKELGKYLRVVTLSDGETVHNAFPDRNFKEEKL